MKPSLLDGDPGWIYAGFVLFGLPVGLLHGIVGETKETKSWTPLVFACWAVLFEAVLLLYLPAHLALTQSRNSMMMLLASVTGIWGVSFLVWIVNLLIVELVVARKFRLASFVVASALGVSLGGLLWGEHQAGDLRILALQSPIEDIDFFAMKTQYSTLDDTDMIVWPEAAGLSLSEREDTSKLGILVARDRATPFSTSFDDSHTPLPHNTMSVFSPLGESARYWKRKLFGGERTSHTPGNQPRAIEVNGHVFGLNVCFDSCFPSVTRETANLPGVEAILLPTLDPGSPYGICQAIHASYTPFRAAENGVVIVRAEATAYSMIVDQRGWVAAEALPGDRSSIRASLSRQRVWTLYTQLGDWFLIVCGLGVAAPLVLKWRASRVQRPD